MTIRRYLLAVSVALGMLLLANGVVPVFKSPGFSYGSVLQGMFRAQTSDALQWTVKCSTQDSDSIESACDKAMPNITGEWVSNNEKSGASVEVQFPVEVELSGVHLFDRGNAKETIQDGHIEFFDGTRYPVQGGIAVLANPTFPNAVLTFPNPVRTVGFKFVVDSVSSSTTAAGLAEIAPQFTILADARSRPERLIGTVGTSTNDVDGVLPLVPVDVSTAQSVLNNFADSTVVTTASFEKSASQEGGTFSIAAQSLPCHWGGQEDSDGTAVLPNGDHRFLCRNGIWLVHGGSASGYGGVQTGNLAECPSGEFCFTIVPVCTVSGPWYLSASTKLWQPLNLAPGDASCSIIAPPPPPTATLRFDLSNDFYAGQEPYYSYADFHWTEAAFFIEDSAGQILSLGTARDTTNTNNGPTRDGWSPVSFDVSSLVQQSGVYHVYWQWKQGWDTSHVKNLRIEYNGQSFLDRDRGADVGNAGDGLWEAWDGGQYTDHYVVVGSSTTPPMPTLPALPPVHLQVTIPSSRPVAQQFTSGMKKTLWMQYKLTAPDEDVAIKSIPIAFAFDHTLVPNDPSLVSDLPINHIRLYASADASMANKIQIGPVEGVALGVGGRARMKFTENSFVVTKEQPIYVTMETDITTVTFSYNASLGFGDRTGGAQGWVVLGSDPSIGSYGIEAESVGTKQVIDTKIINTTGDATGTIASSADHQLYGSSLEVKASTTPPLPSFAGGIIDEPVFQFALKSLSGGVGIKRMEFVGSGTCNGNMTDPGNAKLFDVTNTPVKLIAQWNNQPLADLVYSAYDHQPVSVGSGKSRTFQLQVTTNCSRGQTLQYAIGGAHSYSGTRATVSGIQWFVPSWGASKSIDSPTTRGLPLVGPVLSANMADTPPNIDDGGLVEVPPGNILVCTTPEADRSSYPFEIMRLAMTPENPPAVGAESTLSVRLKNRFDIAQLYTITVDWGDGNTNVYSATRALKGQALTEVPFTHTYTTTQPEGFPIRVRVHNGERAIASALWESAVVPTGGDIVVTPPPDIPPVETPPLIDDRHPIDPPPPTGVLTGLSIVAGSHESIGDIFSSIQEIGSFTLAMSGENRSSNALKIWSASSDQAYATINPSTYVVTVTAAGIAVKFNTPINAQYLKIQVIVNAANTKGVTIQNPATALEVYSPYGQ